MKGGAGLRAFFSEAAPAHAPTRPPNESLTYIWDAGDPALHKLMSEKLGLSGDDLIMDVIGTD